MGWLGHAGMGDMKNGDDKYRMRSGIITRIRCKHHGWQGPPSYYVIKTPRGGLITKCKECHYERDRSGGLFLNPKSIPVELKISRGENGLEGKVCTKCLTWKPLIDYGKRRSRAGKDGSWPVGQQSVCRPCIALGTHRRKYLRFVREAFGKDSEEYRFVETEKRYHRIQAMCWVLGVLAYLAIFPPPKREVRGVLRRMSDFTPAEFLEKLEAKSQEIETFGHQHYRVAVQ